MGLPLSTAHLTVMDIDRGASIQRRLNALGISDREFHEQTGIDRKTLRRAVAGQEKVRPSTYAAIEAALDKLEAKVGGGPVAAAPVVQPASDFIEFDITGDFGVHLVVKGPVADADVLKRQVIEIIREIRATKGEGQPDQ